MNTAGGAPIDDLYGLDPICPSPACGCPDCTDRRASEDEAALAAEEDWLAELEARAEQQLAKEGRCA